MDDNLIRTEFGAEKPSLPTVPKWAIAAARGIPAIADAFAKSHLDRGEQAEHEPDYPIPEEAFSHDARQEERPALALPVVVCGIGMDSKLFFELTRTLDVSRSGCRIHIRTRPQVDSPLAVRFIRRGDAIREESVQILCRVVWLRQDPDGWTIGAATLREAML